MNQRPQDARRAAAQAFMESLDQLQQSLHVTPEQAATKKAERQNPSYRASRPKPPELEPIDPKALEEAAADIEQYIQSQQENT